MWIVVCKTKTESMHSHIYLNVYRISHFVLFLVRIFHMLYFFDKRPACSRPVCADPCLCNGLVCSIILVRYLLAAQCPAGDGIAMAK